MYYEEKWFDNWLWYRRTLDGQWVKISEEQMITRMRKALELVVEAYRRPRAQEERFGLVTRRPPDRPSCGSNGAWPMI